MVKVEDIVASNGYV